MAQGKSNLSVDEQRLLTEITIAVATVKPDEAATLARELLETAIEKVRRAGKYGQAANPAELLAQERRGALPTPLDTFFRHARNDSATDDDFVLWYSQSFVEQIARGLLFDTVQTAVFLSMLDQIPAQPPHVSKDQILRMAREAMRKAIAVYGWAPTQDGELSRQDQPLSPVLARRINEWILKNTSSVIANVQHGRWSSANAMIRATVLGSSVSH
jgi:hypothetical protein